MKRCSTPSGSARISSSTKALAASKRARSAEARAIAAW
jgi:hypothetical protein